MGWFGNTDGGRKGQPRSDATRKGDRPVETVKAVLVSRPGPRSRLPDDLPRRRDLVARRDWR